MNTPTIIGITGGSGSGKTYFLEKLLQSFPADQVSVFSLDNYYLPKDQQLKDKNGIENFDRPESLDHHKFVKDLKSLKSGQDLSITEYNFNFRDHPSQQLIIKSTPVILVEGIFTFHFKEINELLDLKIFIETPDYLMLKRRIIRDGDERGYDISDVLYRFEHHVMPSYSKFISPSRKEADLIIMNHDNFEKAMKVLKAYIEQILN